jgi:hypothetical protein
MECEKGVFIWLSGTLKREGLRERVERFGLI